MENSRSWYSWEKAVLEVLTETRREYLVTKISAAERAICKRLRDRPNDREELMALKDALHAIQILYLQSSRNDDTLNRGIAV